MSATQKQPSHQPDGLMCMACVRALDNCAALDFAAMKVIGKWGEVRIVKCAGFTKHDA